MSKNADILLLTFIQLAPDSKKEQKKPEFIIELRLFFQGCKLGLYGLNPQLRQAATPSQTFVARDAGQDPDCE